MTLGTTHYREGPPTVDVVLHPVSVGCGKDTRVFLLKPIGNSPSGKFPFNL